jgi:hypothetical protein
MKQNDRGHVMAQLVEELRYKPEGRGFDSRWCHWNFSFSYSFRPNCAPGVESDCNRNEYREYFVGGKGGRRFGLKKISTFMCRLLKSDGLSLLETSWPVQDCKGIVFLLPLHRSVEIILISVRLRKILCSDPGRTATIFFLEYV